MRTMDNQILQSGSEAVGQLVEWLSNPIAAEGAALYVGIAVVLGVGGTRLWDWYSEDDDEEVAFSDLLDEETLKDGKAERQLLDDIAESHKTITAHRPPSNGTHEPHASASSGRRRCTSLSTRTTRTTGI